ncbi:hypothetical protein PB787_004579 [Vibrio parahaemolyticus]|nr:hypothetical protein [Vibrio parahaemolyticus]
MENLIQEYREKLGELEVLIAGKGSTPVSEVASKIIELGEVHSEMVAMVLRKM